MASHRLKVAQTDGARFPKRSIQLMIPARAHFSWTECKIIVGASGEQQTEGYDQRCFRTVKSSPLTETFAVLLGSGADDPEIRPP